MDVRVVDLILLKRVMGLFKGCEQELPDLLRLGLIQHKGCRQ